MLSSTALRVRPAPVTVAVLLLYLAALMQAVSGVAALATYSARLQAYTEAYAGTNMAKQVHWVMLPLVSGAILAIMVGGVFGVLGVLVDRGNRIGRLVTWTFGGLVLCCAGGGMVGGQFSEGIYNSTSTDPSDERVYDAVQAALPRWYTPVTTFIAFVGVAAVLLTVVLLAFPSSHQYFRRRDAEWEPPPAPELHVATYDPPEHEESEPTRDRHDPPAAAL